MSVSFHAVDLQRFVNYFSLKIWTYSVLSTIYFDFGQKREKKGTHILQKWAFRT